MPNTPSSIYDYDDRITRTYNLIKNELSVENQQLIKQYDDLMIISSIGNATRQKHLETILHLTRFLNKDWKNASKTDIDQLVIKIIKKYTNNRGQETHSSHDHKKILKIFYRWLKLGSRKFKEVGDPIETKYVNVKTPVDKLSRENLITENDRVQLLHACGENIQDRAFIDCHLEAGTRPGEIINLCVKHVVFDKYGAIIKVDGKTGSRPIRLIRSSPNLSFWINVHPLKNNLDAPLWIHTGTKKFGLQLSYNAARKMINKRCMMAGLSKKINLNLFRHSSVTEVANFLTESQLRKRHGWSSTSKMPSRYVHMINADVDNAIFKYYGLSSEKINDNKTKTPKICHVCKIINTVESTICSQCGKSLDLKTTLEQESLK